MSDSCTAKGCQFSPMMFYSEREDGKKQLIVSIERGGPGGPIRDLLVCTIHAVGQQTLFALGTAWCSTDDKFCLSFGRRMAFKRALEDVVSVEVRRNLWKDFRENLAEIQKDGCCKCQQ